MSRTATRVSVQAKLESSLEFEQATSNSSQSVSGALSGRLDGAPVAVRVVDVDGAADHLDLPVSPSGQEYQGVVALLRRGGAPLCWIALPVSSGGRVSLKDLPVPESDTAAVDATQPDRGELEDALFSVVVTTCADAAGVIRCLERLCSSSTGPFEVIVVENRPEGSEVERALRERFAGDHRIRYVEEHRPGLSRARNTGLRIAQGQIVAFTDDDILTDEGWMAAVRAGFARDSDVDCVTGLILPVELETTAQMLVERFAGFGKGLVPRVYSLEAPPADQPLFPYTAGHFGSGANMAFRTEVIRRLGGFDPALGTGTPARGGEDLDIYIRLLYAGGRLAYEPRATVWHRHPDTQARLRSQVFSYGVGLGAMLTKQLARGPERMAMLGRSPSAFRYLLDPTSRKNAGKGSHFPRYLDVFERMGLLLGPLAYMRSLRRAHR